MAKKKKTFNLEKATDEFAQEFNLPESYEDAIQQNPHIDNTPPSAIHGLIAEVTPPRQKYPN